MAVSGAQRKLLLVSNMALIIRLVHLKLSEGCTIALKAVLICLSHLFQQASGKWPGSQERKEA